MDNPSSHRQHPLPASNDSSAAPTPAFYSPDESIKILGATSGPPSPADHRRKESTSTDLPSPSSPNGSSPSKRPSMRNRARTNSSKILSRLTSRGSVDLKTSPPGSPSSEAGNKIDMAALSRAKGKYKSGINWDTSNLILPSGEIEPFMEVADVSGSPTQEKDFSLPQGNDEMLAAGGTAAAKAYYNSMNVSFANTMFPAQQRAAVDAQQRAAAESAVSRNFIPIEHYRRRNASGSTHGSQSSRHMPSLNTAVHAIANGSHNSSPVTPSGQIPAQSSGPPSAWRGPIPAPTAISLPSTEENQQCVVEQPSTNSAGSTNDASRPTSAGKQAEEQTTDTSKSPASSIRSKRRTFLGLTSKSTDRVDRFGGKKSRRSSIASVPDVQDTSADAGTAGRRRRYQDTRELNLLAAELAREAAIEALGTPQTGYPAWSQTPSASGSRTPADRRASSNSNGGGLGLQGVSPSASPIQGNLGPSSQNGFQPLAPPFARDSRNHTPVSSNPGSPRSSQLPLDQPGGQNHTKNAAKGNVGSSPALNKTSNIPNEMLAGISDGPYPMHLPELSGSDGLSSGATTPRRSRIGSTSGAATDGRQTGSSAKKSVLSMSMHDPETEMQGLTKLPKSGKSTPFGSRAPSRNVTPKNSFTRLNELAKQQAAANRQTSVSGSSKRRSQGEDAKPLTLVPGVDAPALPVRNSLVDSAESERDSSQASRSAESGDNAAPKTVTTGVTSSTAPPARDSSNISHERNTHRLTAGSTSSSTGSQSKKTKARLSFFSAFNRSSKQSDASPSRAASPVVGSNGFLRPDSQVGASSSRSSFPSGPTSHLSTSTFTSENAGARDSGTSLTQLTPNSEASRDRDLGASSTPRQTNGLAPAAAVTGKELDLQRSRSPSRPPRSNARPIAVSNYPVSSREKGTASAPSYGNTSGSRNQQSSDVQTTPFATHPPKRPGNLKRLFSKFGSSGKVPKAAPNAANGAPPLPTTTSTASTRGTTPSAASALSSTKGQQGTQATEAQKRSTSASDRTIPAREGYDLKVDYPSGGPASANRFLQNSTPVSVGR